MRDGLVQSLPLAGEDFPGAVCIQHQVFAWQVGDLLITFPREPGSNRPARRHSGDGILRISLLTVSGTVAIDSLKIALAALTIRLTKGGNNATILQFLQV